jgi:hypothetical protein
MSILVPYGMPGMGAAKTYAHRIVFRGLIERYLPGGKQIDGLISRDPGNTGQITILRAGLLMGKVTATGYYAPTVLGVTTGAYTSGGTTLNVSAAAATELARRVGSSGTATLKAIGPPTAAGTNAATAVTYSAVNVSTGDVTVTSLGVNKVAGTLITAADGSEVPVTFIPDGWGVRVVDADGTGITVPFPELPISGVVYSNKLINWPSDASIQDYITLSLNGGAGAGGGKFTFDHKY